MTDIFKKYEEFGRILSDPAPFSFHTLCRRIRVCPSDLDEIVFEELGVSGEELVSIIANGMFFC